VPLLLAAEGLRAVTLVAFGCYIAAIATTALLPEPHGRALDGVSDDLKPTSTTKATARQRLSPAPLSA
jgi:hypothetical protein